MFGNLLFITFFDNFLLPNQGDLTAHCFSHFLTSNVLRLRCNNTLIFPMEISVLKFQACQFDEKPAFKIAFLNDQNTLVISPSHFWFSHVKTTILRSRVWLVVDC